MIWLILLFINMMLCGFVGVIFVDMVPVNRKVYYVLNAMIIIGTFGLFNSLLIATIP
jgi:hypothetical protein